METSSMWKMLKIMGIGLVGTMLMGCDFCLGTLCEGDNNPPIRPEDENNTDENEPEDTAIDTEGEILMDCYVVKDPYTGLYWTDPSFNLDRNMQQATDFCSNLIADSYTDWRLPRVQELIGAITGCPFAEQCPLSDPGCLGDECFPGNLCNECLPQTAGDPTVCYWGWGMAQSFSGPCYKPLWSSSEPESDQNKNWVVGFKNSKIEALPKDSLLSFRCVRADLVKPI